MYVHMCVYVCTYCTNVPQLDDMCTYVCTYGTYVHAHIHVRTFTHYRIKLDECLQAHTYVRIFLDVHLLHLPQLLRYFEHVIHAHTHCTYVRTDTCILRYVCTYVCTHKHVCTHTYMHATHTQPPIHTHIHTHTHIRTHTHTYTHAHTHTHTCTLTHIMYMYVRMYIHTKRNRAC